MKSFLLAICVVVSLSVNVLGIVTIDADDPLILYTGRINHADPKAPIMWWPGSDVIANFEGTSINVKLHDYGNNYFYVIIDDGTPSLISLTPGTATYTAASGLTNSVHKIRLFKRTETQEGEVAFKGFELEDGKSLVAPPTRPQRRIEYFGDSITSGHSVASTTGDTNNANGKDNYYTYASLTARNLEAEYHCISLSGIGLYVDTWGFGGNMQTLYYDKQSDSTKWDFSEWTPHIVIVNLGQNDYWGNYSQSGAQDNYIKFAQTLRGHYPDTHIILALGSMNATQPSSPWPGYLQYAVNELNSTYRDPKVYSLIFPYSGNPHPTIARHADMAEQLTEFIQSNIPGFGNGPDVNADGYVNNLDLAVLGSQWLKKACDLCDGADLTRDGNVNMNDLLVIANNWLKDFALLGHWKFDGDALDSSGYMNNATVMGDPLWEPEGGRIGGALLLDGLNDYVSAPFILDPAVGAFSVLAWIKDGAPGQVLVSQTSGVNWLLADSSRGYLMTDLKGTGRSGKAMLSDTVITDGNWHRVGLVWDGNDRILYVDGVVVATDAQAEIVGSLGGLYIGTGKAMEPGSYWSGLIDDVRIYNKALRAEEVAALAQ
jgi:hypothetical protein